jgi:hypothetical protein
VWRGSVSLGESTEIFTDVLYSMPTCYQALTFAGDYCYLQGTAWEWGDDPIQDDPRLFDVNVENRANFFAQQVSTLFKGSHKLQVRTRASTVRTNNVLIPFGCDFQFENAVINFKARYAQNFTHFYRIWTN